MIRSIAAALMGLALLPSAVLAQATTEPGPGPGGPGHIQLTDTQRSQLSTTMQQSRTQMQQLHTQFRSAMLGSISSVHRTALANIVGQLAIAPNPDYRGAAQQIDALLSAGERQSVINSETNFRTQSKALRTQEHQAFLSVLTPDQRAQVAAEDAQREAHMQQFAAAHQHRTPDAGMLLLMASQGGRGGFEHGMGMHRGGFGGPGA